MHTLLQQGQGYNKCNKKSAHALLRQGDYRTFVAFMDLFFAVKKLRDIFQYICFIGRLTVKFHKKRIIVFIYHSNVSIIIENLKI